MRIAHVALESHQCTFEVWDGDIDEAEVRAHLRRLAEDPAWPPGVLNLVDLTTVGKISIPDPDLVAVLREGTVLERELRTALVVNTRLVVPKPPEFEEARNATGVTTFSNVHAASAHLGIPAATAEQILERLRESL